MRYLLLASLVLASACGGDDDDDDDDVTTDARVGAIDSSADTPDAPASTADADLGTDAPPGPDADPCSTIGKTCELDGTDCDDGQRCEFSTGGNFCTKIRDGCGGFAGATCDDPAAPLCHYLPSADFGPCLSAFERDCICERSPGSILECP